MLNIFTKIYQNKEKVRIFIILLFSILLFNEIYTFMMFFGKSGSSNINRFLYIIGDVLIIYFVYKNTAKELYKLMIIGSILHIPYELVRLSGGIVSRDLYIKYNEVDLTFTFVYVKVLVIFLWVLLSLVYINKEYTKKISIITIILAAFILLYSITDKCVETVSTIIICYYIVYIAIIFLGLYIASFAAVEDGTININDLKNEHENRILDIKNQNNIDADIETLKKIKELYDEGIITKKEFELKKKQALKLSDDNE